VAPEVFEAMQPYLSELYGNASSMYRFDRQFGAVLNTARKQIAALLGAEAEEIVSLPAAWRVMPQPSGPPCAPSRAKRVTTRVEHPAVLNLCKSLHSQKYNVSFLPVDAQGRVSLDALEAALRDDTALVSMMYANNENGVILPIAEATAMTGAWGIPFHTDAVQAVGKIPINLAELSVNYLALSGHKLHAPKGIGALYSAEARSPDPSSWAGTRNTGAVRARKTWPPSWRWAKRPNSPPRIATKKTPACAPWAFLSPMCTAR
jgi:cysteine desulfurase